MNTNKKPEEKSIRKYNNASSLVTTMIVYIGLGLVLGMWLDKKYGNGKNIFVIIGSLLGIVGAMYHAIRMATRK